MARTKGPALKKHTLNLYDGEFDELTALFPDIKPSRVIRELVRYTIQMHQQGDALPNLAELHIEVDLDGP